MKGWLIVLCLVFSAVSLAHVEHLWWDSATYIGMGKFLYSGGASGLWEPSRPLVLPLILGAIWKIGLPIAFTSKMLALLIAVTCIVFAYLAASLVIGKEKGFLAALLLAFTPAFLAFSTAPMTEVLSTALMLASIYYALNKNYPVAGVLAGFSVMTRFLQLVPALVLGAWIIFKEKKYQKPLNYLLCFLIPVVPYLLFNNFQYANPLYPFFLQLQLSQNTGWLWHEPWWWYFKEMLFENFLLLFALPGMLMKKTRLFSILAVVSVIVYSFIAQKEHRFIIAFLPYFAILAAAAMRKWKGALVCLFLVQAIFIFPFVPHAWPEPPLRAYAEDVAVSSPLYVVNSDAKAELAYYAMFDADLAISLRGQLGEKAMLLSDCDLLCKPGDDVCELERGKLFAGARAMADEEITQNGCSYFILNSN